MAFAYNASEGFNTSSITGPSSGSAEFKSFYELAPIILVNGIASGTSGMQSISLLLSSLSIPSAVSANSGDVPPFAHFVVPAGDTLIDNQIAHWPMANLVVAANAVISQPLRVSLLMQCPAGPSVSYTGKLAVITALQNSLGNHIALGGSFIVCTPSFIYNGCLLLALRNVTDFSPGSQVQMQYLWEFEQPLITSAAAQGAQNQKMAPITQQVYAPNDPPFSNSLLTDGLNPNSNVATGLMPSLANSPAYGVQPFNLGSSFMPQLNQVAPITPGT